MYYVYILTNRKNGVLYVGVTSNITKRIFEHKNNLVEGFTSKYNIHNLVYFETFDDIKDAIIREKTMKRWNRAWKIRLIEKENKKWRDLYSELI